MSNKQIESSEFIETVEHKTQNLFFFLAITAGMTLKGSVILKVAKKMTPTDLVVKFEGKESTVVTKATRGSV